MKLDTDTMTAKERFLCVIRHEEPDRLPIFLMGVPEYSKCYLELTANNEKMLDEWTDKDENVLLTPLGDLTTRYFFGAEVETHGVGISYSFEDKEVNDKGAIVGDVDHAKKSELLDKARKLMESSQKHPSMTNLEGQGIAYRSVGYGGTIHGVTILPNGHEYGWYIDGYLKTAEQIENWFDTYGWPHEKKINKFDIESYNQFQSQCGDKIYMVPQIGGMQLYESTWPMMGQARFGYIARKNPELIQKLVDSRKEAQLKIIDELARVKPAAIFGGDDMGQKGRSLLSPEMFRKFFKKPYSEIFQKIHDIGAIAFNHSCGNIVDILPDYIEAGLNGWQSLEIPSEINHAELKKKYGDKLLLVGGIDSSNIMTMQGPKQVTEHVKQQIKAMGKNGGYIAGPAHDYLNVSLENALAMRDAIYKYGRYPLK
jgi:uroporphyrinogen-III decarboxylase